MTPFPSEPSIQMWGQNVVAREAAGKVATPGNDVTDKADRRDSPDIPERTYDRADLARMGATGQSR
jgi:hypothetical protein